MEDERMSGFRAHVPHRLDSESAASNLRRRARGHAGAGNLRLPGAPRSRRVRRRPHPGPHLPVGDRPDRGWSGVVDLEQSDELLGTSSRLAAPQYALSSATQVAVSNIRYTPLLNSNQTLNASPPSYCWGTSAPSELTIQSGEGTQSNQVAVWCSTAWNPSSVSTRVRDDLGLPHERGPRHQPRPMRGQVPDSRRWSSTTTRPMVRNSVPV